MSASSFAVKVCHDGTTIPLGSVVAGEAGCVLDPTFCMHGYTAGHVAISLGFGEFGT